MVSLLAHSGFVLPALVAVALTIASLATMGVLQTQEYRRRRADAAASDGKEALSTETLNHLVELVASTSTAIMLLELKENSLRRIYENPAATRLLMLSPELRGGPGLPSAQLTDIHHLLAKQCEESKARAAQVRFEFETNHVTQHRWFNGCVFPIRTTATDCNRFACLIENISSIKENESSLVEARERLAAALEAGSLATWDWDIQRDVVYGDSVLVNLYGVPREYMLGAPVNKFLDHIHPDDRDRIRQEIHSALELGKVYSEQYRVFDKNGRVRWLSATGRVLPDASGKPARFPGVTMDITRLKEVEAALHQATITSQNQLQELESIYTYAPVGLAVIDSNLHWLRANQVMAGYFSKTPADFIGRSIHVVLPTIAESLEHHLQTAIDSKKPLLNVEVSGECPITPGSIRIWNTSFYPLVGSNDEILGVNVVTEDATEDKRSMEEHRAHRTVLNMVALEYPLEVMLNLLTDAIDEIFPGATSYILRNHGGLVRVAQQPHTVKPSIKEIFASPPSRLALQPFSDAIASRQELIISDMHQQQDQEYFARALEVGFRSCWIKPIVLSDSSTWGACVVHHSTINQNPTQAERDHLDVLIRLAASVIERRAFLDKLTTTTERLQLAEQAGHIGVFDWNTQTDHLVWTPQLEISFGLAPGTFEGTFDAWKKRVHPDDLVSVLDHLARLKAEKETSFKHEYRIILPSGELRWIAAQGEFSYNEAGEAKRMIGVAIDITAQKRLEEQGRRDQESLQLALEAGNLGLWDWHIPSGAVQFGGYWASMLGYAPDEIEPHVRAWEILVHPDDRAEVERQLTLHFAGKASVYEVEHRLRKKSGEWVWILDRGRVVERDATGAPIRAVGIHADIHEQRMIRERLNSEAKRKDEFIATLAHELRNPLAPLRTGLEIIRRDPSGTAAEKAREMMQRQLAHMVRLIEDLLDISRISLGRLELRMERVSLRTVIESALESSRPAIDAAQHELAVRMPREELFVHGDSARLSQVIGNLLVNAAKYTPVSGHIAIEATAKDKQVSIAISDSGLGIPQNKLTDIFEMFSQIQSPLDRTQGGLGIGLALVRRVVQMHGGTVYAESPGLGLGSTFTVRLPEA
jgi:PAS domain S-box-containing protein